MIKDYHYNFLLEVSIFITQKVKNILINIKIPLNKHLIKCSAEKWNPFSQDDLTKMPLGLAFI